MLEQLGISVNSDSVIRRTFYKYLHPKEAFVANGILNNELVRYVLMVVTFSFLNSYLIQIYYRVALGKPKEQTSDVKGKFAKRYRDAKDDLTSREENGGLKFVYPYGATLNVRKPSFPILSSGPVSYPANRPLAAFYMSPKRGKLFVMGSMAFLEDEFFEKEDN